MAFGLYEDFELEDLKGLRKKILSQRAKGVSKFSYNGQSFEYSSPGQMLVVADEIQREIHRRFAKERGWVPAINALTRTYRPLSE